MTDNRTTELLCKLLEERGEDYTRNDFGITWSYYSDPHTATESMDGTLIVTGLTPEQAIAATLGGGECKLAYGEREGGEAMSMLSAQCDELREAARNIQGKLGRCLYRRKDVNEMQQVSGMLFEAADTIESLRDRLLLGDPYEAVACEHVITPDGLHRLLDEWDTHPGRAATDDEMMRLVESCKQYPKQAKRKDEGVSESYSRWQQLFGTPERAARTMVDSCNDDYDYGCGGCPVARMNCKCGDYDALLEWLRGDA